MNMLEVYIQGWQESAKSVLSIADDLTAADWATPTDLPGWNVRDVVAHLSHLEAVLAGSTRDVVGDAAAGAIISSYTETGVEERRKWTTDQVVTELRDAVNIRTGILADVPDDPKATADKTPGDIGWNWDTLLRNRCIDMWSHEQDIRRALNNPGGFDGTAAQVVTMALSLGMPFVVGKKVKPSPGTVVKWTITGEVPTEVAVRVGDDGRATMIDQIEGDVTELTMSTEAFHVLAAGRRQPDDVDVTITGDEALGREILAHMAITP